MGVGIIFVGQRQPSWRLLESTTINQEGSLKINRLWCDLNINLIALHLNAEQ